MVNAAPFPVPHNEQPADGGGASSRKIADAIKLLLAALPLEEQDKILQEITAMLRPITAHRAGGVLGALVRLLPHRKSWTVEDIKQQVQKEGVGASPKELYNAIGYLTRKGHIQRVGYGQYIVGGNVIVSADEFGGAPSRVEEMDPN
jgi:hypothetical protein